MKYKHRLYNKLTKISLFSVLVYCFHVGFSGCIILFSTEMKFLGIANGCTSFDKRQNGDVKRDLFSLNNRIL
jgi:hypothetical protein